MTKTIVGQVSIEERDAIQTLYERKNGLIELCRVLNPDDAVLYEKLIKDVGETVTNFQNWWTEKSLKYNWKSCEGGNWEINFTTCEIFLISPQ